LPDVGWIRRKKRTLRGTAQVVACSRHNGRATSQTCRLNLVVQAPGLPAYSVEHTQICPAKKWPQPGATVPVLIDPEDPNDLKIDFDSMPELDEVLRHLAEQQAAALNDPRRGQPTVFNPQPGTSVTIVGGTAQDIPPEMRAGLEQMLGVDIDGDGRIGGASGTPGTSGAAATVYSAGTADTAGDDRLVQLERLARLHRSGALTDDEFAREKRRLLGA
jgi:hypothetical protein